MRSRPSWVPSLGWVIAYLTLRGVAVAVIVLLDAG